MPSIHSRRRSDQIPDPSYRQEAQRRELKEQGWDGDRAVEYVRKRVREDKEGRKFFDPRA